MERIGKYEIREVLGRGGMGVVYLAVDPGIGRTVALKVMPPGDAQSAELRERFLREARAAGRLQHPNIVVIHDLGEEAGSLYIAMEYLEGRTLAERIATPNGRPDVGTVLELLAQVARGLHYAHERGVVHRDIKPANILVTNDGVAKILDFGIARAGDQRMTKTGQVMGTVYYMSPEQINGAQLDGRSDVFSAGVVLYELLTGDVPFEAESTGATMMRILTAPTPSLATRMPLFPPVLDEIVARALGKKPEERYASAAEFAKALDSARKLCEEQRPAPAATAPTAPAKAMAATVAPTVLHGASPFAPTTNPVFLNDMAEASAARGAAAAAPAPAPVSPSGPQTRPVQPDQPWRWWRVLWPARDVRHATITARMAAGVSICIALAGAVLTVARASEYDPTADPQRTATFLFTAGAAALTYAVLAKQVLRFSRIAALLVPLLSLGLVYLILEYPRGLGFLTDGSDSQVVSLSLLILALLSQLTGVRAAFAYHGAIKQGAKGLWRPRLWPTAALAGAYLCALGLLYYLVYAQILPSQEARATRALLREQRDIKPFLTETLGASEETVPGYYVGSVFGSNFKFAKIEMVVNSAADGKLTGCFGIHRPLSGSGSLTGSHLGVVYWLWVDAGEMVMTFNGVRAGGKLEGNYTVKNKSTGVLEQRGTFELRRDQLRGLDGSFAPAKCPDDSVIE